MCVRVVLMSRMCVVMGDKRESQWEVEAHKEHGQLTCLTVVRLLVLEQLLNLVLSVLVVHRVHLRQDVNRRDVEEGACRE